MFIDVSVPDYAGALALSYRAGGALFAASGGTVVEVRSVDEIYAELARRAKGELSEVQICGHGYSGYPVIGLPRGLKTDARGFFVDQGALRRCTLTTLKHPEWSALAGGTVWFRSCSTMQGSKGHRLAQYFSDVGINVVGHLCVIGTWGVHSYLVGVRAGKSAWWSIDMHPGDSTPWSPRTIPCTQMSLPPWAFDSGIGVRNA